MNKLHLGCGQQYLPGYINLEYAANYKDLPFKVDMMGSGMELPFKNNSLEEVISFHVIEHMPRPEPKNSKHKKWRKNVNDFLKESYRVLKHGGKIIAECPDVKEILKDIVDNNKWEMLDHVFGLDRYPGDTHQWGYTQDTLAELFKNNGFDNIKISKGTDYHAISEPSLRVEATKIGLKRINIEPTSACNLECSICSRDESKRPNANMDFNLFRSIIYQLYNLGLQDVELRFFLSGEPLVAGKNLINMLKHVKNLGFHNTLIHTNGTLLNLYGEGILNAGIGTISISMDGADKITYESIRINSRFEKTVSYVQKFLADAKKYDTKTIIQTIVEYGTDKKEYEEKMKALLPGADEYYVRYPHNWNTLDSISPATTRTGRVKECFPSENLSVYANGLVPICCADLNGDYILADANTESILDIWINKLGDIRDRMSKGMPIPELCDKCERYAQKQSVQEETTSVAGSLSDAERFLESNQLPEARVILERLVNDEMLKLDALNDLAVLEYLDGNFSLAVEIINRVLTEDPQNEVALDNLSKIQAVAQ